MSSRGLNIHATQIGIIPLNGCKMIADKINNYLVEWRNEEKKTFLIDHSTPRFGTGEGKAVLNESIRGKDIYILIDVCNYSIDYTINGIRRGMSPDEHYQDLKRVIAAISGKAKKITIIMPYLYEGRQHRKTTRESLDCALMLQELVRLGVDSIITFDVHDPRVQCAIPLTDFESIKPTYQFLKTLVKKVDDIQIDSEHLMMISPDEGAMDRSIYFSNVLGVDIGMFYKRRDYTKIIAGKNPIIAHEYLGRNVEGMDVIVVDDILASGESILDVAYQLKKQRANRVFIMCSFGLFTNGLGAFDQAYKEGVIDKVFSTNLVYQNPELFAREYYESVDMSKYVAMIIDTLNKNETISPLLNPVNRINRLLENRGKNSV